MATLCKTEPAKGKQACIELVQSALVQGRPTRSSIYELLSAIDASPLLLKVVNCPALAFDRDLDFAKLQQSLVALLDEYAIVGGRVRKLSKPELATADQPYLKAAPYCIQLPAEGGNVLLAEAYTDTAVTDIDLNQPLAAPFGLCGGKIVLPPWYQPLTMSALLRGDEPLFKLQVTHCKGGGCILAATMPHLLADSHSSTLLLTRLAQLYRQLQPSFAAAGAATAVTVAADCSAAGDSISRKPTEPVMNGVTFQHMRGSQDSGPAATIHAHAKEVEAVSPCSSKALLLAQGAAAGTGSSKHAQKLKALSLDLQSADRPSWGEVLHWLSAAVKEGLAAAKRFPGSNSSSLTSRLLYIPHHDLLQLKVLAAAGSHGEAARRISTNDALSALVWLTFCQMRGRALPGSSSSSSSSRGLFGCFSPAQARVFDGQAAAGSLGVAIDIRQNCSDLKQQLPSSYMGNAAWCLHIDSISNSSTRAAATTRPSMDASTAADTAAGGAFDVCGYAAPLQAAAAAVRAGLVRFRSTAGAGSTLLELVAEQQAAPKSVLVRNLARLAVKVDGFITSWQFPVHNIDFGAGSAVQYSCAVRPTPPWQAAVLPSNPGQGGVQLLLTVPAPAAAALKSSPVLQQLVPNASFHT